MIKPQLADVSGLPVHPTARNPLTGQPVQAIGLGRNGEPIWPVMGGSQPLGGPAPSAAQPQAGLPGGQPAGQFLPWLGGQPAPVAGQGALPMGQPGMFPVQQQTFGQPGVQAQPYGQQQYGAPQQQYGPAVGATPPAPYGYGPPQQFPFAAVQVQQPPAVGQPGQQVPAAGQPGQQGAGPGQPAGQQQPAGQPAAADGGWDKPYPQKPLAEMTDAEQNSYWKYHNRKLEDRLRSQGDYDQLKQQLAQLQQMTQTEWQRAVLEAESRGRASAMEQAAGQMVAVAFQGAASQRMTPDQIQAALSRLDSKSFVHNGQVDIAAVHQYVDMIAPARQNSSLVPLIPPAQQLQGQQLPLQQITLGAQQPLLPGQPGYAQQPTFGPLGQQGQSGFVQQQYGGQPQYPAQPQYPVQQQYGGQPYPVQQQYGGAPVQGGYNVPVPGVPNVYQPATAMPQPSVQGAGLAGLPSLNGGRAGLPAATDFGQGPAVPAAPANAMQSGAAMAAARHSGRTRSQQLAETRGN